jgi:hypothetical protein
VCRDQEKSGNPGPYPCVKTAEDNLGKKNQPLAGYGKTIKSTLNMMHFFSFKFCQHSFDKICNGNFKVFDEKFFCLGSRKKLDFVLFSFDLLESSEMRGGFNL